MTSLTNRLIILFLFATRPKFISFEALLKGIHRDRKAGPARPSARMKRRLTVYHETVAGVEVYRLGPKQPAALSRHVLYLHGGAYVRPITSFHWRFLQKLVEETGCSVSVPLYPLAPESTCIQTVEAISQVYRHFYAGGVAPTLMGDSAGGGLAIALCYALRQQSIPLPSSLVLICPWVDVSMTHPDIAESHHLDPMLNADALKAAGRLYAGQQPVRHPYASPRYGDLSGLPKMLTFIGTRDILSHDGIAFAEAARTAGVESDIQVGEGMIHVWPVLPIAEATAALQHIAWHLKAQPTS